VLGTAHQPAGEQPAGRGGYDLPPPWRHQPGGCDRRGAPIRAAPDGCRDLGLQCFADWAQTAGGADKRQPANQFAMIGAELSRDTAACRRAYQVNRRGEGIASASACSAANSAIVIPRGNLARRLNSTRRRDAASGNNG
jgi:hypothetical protein